MRIAAKLTVVLSLVVLVVMTGLTGLRLHGEARIFEQEMRRDHHRMGRGLGAAIAEIWEDQGTNAAVELVDRANTREADTILRWVWLDVPTSHPHAPRAPVSALEPVSDNDVAHWVDRDGVGTLYSYVPLPIPLDRPGALEISESLVHQREFIRQSLTRRVFTVLVVLLSSAAVVLGLGGLLVGRPAQQLIEAFRRIGDGDLNTRLALAQRDEFGEIATEMNAMCDRLADAQQKAETANQAKLIAVEQLRMADRLSTVGQLASGIAHELGTPLNVVGGRARMIATGEVTDAEALDSARIISEQADRMTRIIRQLLDFARGRKPEKATEDLSDVIERSLALLQPMARKRSAELRFQRTTTIQAPIDSGQIQQVLMNLLVNGMDAMPHGGPIDVAIHCDDEHVAIAVTDAGEGIPEENRGRIFDPFFSTKGVGEGTGLGLAVSYGIVSEHGGRITVDTALGRGSTFTVWLPVT